MMPMTHQFYGFRDVLEVPELRHGESERCKQDVNANRSVKTRNVKESSDNGADGLGAPRLAIVQSSERLVVWCKRCSTRSSARSVTEDE